MNKQIVFTRVNTAELLDVPTPELKADQVMVETIFSTISCGTEKANITGCKSVAISLEEENTPGFPRSLGYSSAGIVIGKGEAVQSVQIGDRVAMCWSVHKKINVLTEDNVFKIPEGVSFQDAAICHIGIFPLAALRKAKLEIGESLLVMGLGILGLLACQLAKAAGAVPVIAVDPVAERREKALQYGADYALDPFEPGFIEKVKALTEGGVNAAIEVTGLGAGLNQCLDCVKAFGRIALLGCIRDPNFKVDYYRKIHGPGVTLIGANTFARPKFESSPNFFTKEDDMKTLFRLVSLGRIRLESMVEEVCSPNDCTEIYHRLVEDPNFPTVVQFDWRMMK